MIKILMNSAILFVFALLWNGLVHTVILKDFIPVISEIRRPDFDEMIWMSLPLTFILVFLYSVGVNVFAKARTYKEGIVFGLYFGAVAGVLVNFNQYLLYPIPGYIHLTWFAFGLVEFVTYGLISVYVFKNYRSNDK